MAFSVPGWPQKPTAVTLVAVLLVASQAHCEVPSELQNLCPTATLAQCREGFTLQHSRSCETHFYGLLGHMEVNLSYCLLEVNGNIHFV